MVRNRIVLLMSSSLLASTLACHHVTPTPTPPPPSQQLTIVTTYLPPGAVDRPYAAKLDALGGTPPYSWEAAGLPPGLLITGDGVIYGTPTKIGVFEVDIVVNDSSALMQRVTTRVAFVNLNGVQR